MVFYETREIRTALELLGEQYFKENTNRFKYNCNFLEHISLNFGQFLRIHLVN